MSNEVYDVIVVGGGIAGLTSALYTARQGMKTLMITKDIGGQALLTPHIENYPGFSSISGFELTDKVRRQVENFGAEFVYDEVTNLKERDKRFFVVTHGKEYEALSLILTFGKTPKDLGVPGEKELTGKGVSYCAVCDAPLFKGKVVALVGVGEQATEAALLLCKFANKVYFISKSKSLNKENLKKCESKFEFLLNSKVVKINGKEKVEAIVIKDLKKGEEKEIKVDGIFIEIGYTAKTDFVRGFVKVNEKGEIVVDKLQRTSREGVFAAGDVTDIPFKQAVISAGDGAKAGLSAYAYVQKVKGKTAVLTDWKALRKEEGFSLHLNL
jgi:thioredoxin reductase (NADPH)